MAEERADPLKARVQGAVFRSLLGLLRALPYETRVAFGGKIAAFVVAPLAGFRRRIRKNLREICPELGVDEVQRLTWAVPDNFGRTLTELFSPEEFVARLGDVQIEGPGLVAMEAAKAEGRPSILVSGHFGNYDAVRSTVIARGFSVGGLYRPLNNRVINDIYVATISQIGTPLFERGRRGMAQMVKFLRDGGTLAILIDQHMGNGARLTYFRKTAMTGLSAAELALKYNAVVVPCYGIRQHDGVSFRVVLEEPVPHTTAEVMTQALNDSLEAQVRAHMGQWLWIHRRWKAKPLEDVAEDEEPLI